MGVKDVVKSWLNLEVYIYVMLAVGSFMVVFGSSRRRYNNAVLRFLIMLFFNSSFILFTFMMGQMASKITGYRLFFPIWAGYLILFLGLSDAITAYSLEDNEQWRSSFLNIYIAIAWMTMVGASLKSQNLKLRMFITALAIFSSYFKGIVRIEALKNGTKNGVAMGSKPVADFMANLPAGSAYHNYVVVEGITVGKVWSCEGRLLSAAGDPDSKMKDLCSSFSMYNLLCCHFGGYNSFPQSTRDGQWEFVRDDLLQGDDYKRPFQLIELELGFLHDRFYTKYAIMFEKYIPVLKLIFFVFAAVVSIVVQRLIVIPAIHESIPGVDFYIRVTRIIIGVFMCLEALQIFLFAVSNWGKILLLCEYVGKPSWRGCKLYEQFVQLVCSFPSSKLWGRQLGQYNFLQSFNKRPIFDTIYAIISQSEDPGKGRTGSTFVPLPPQVQRAVLAWIKQNGRRLTKGRASLINNGVGNQELLSACEFKETAKVIMVWHIATGLCEFQHRSKSKFVVPVSLSRYCAYLVAFAPRLLPDHYAQTKYHFDAAVTSAEVLLKGYKSMEDKCSWLMNFSEIAQQVPTDIVAVAGVRVAKLLKEEVGDDEERLWKILGDFWTEMVLFVAPTDDPWPHAEHLVQGGQFLTHLMALLFHAGISKREFIQDGATKSMANLEIPTIDLSPFFAGEDDDVINEKKEVKDMITEACSEYGFFQIVNHGVPLSLLNRAIELSKTFFAFSDEEKMKCSPEPGAPLPAGYSKQPESSPDKNEYILMFPPDSGFNLLPGDPPQFRESLEEIFSCLSKLGEVMESILNDCLGLPQGYLKEYNGDRSWDFMVALHYFPATETDNNGITEHEDGNCFTFVVQDEAGGLEVRKNGEWVPVIPEPGKIVVNVSDVIQVLSNKKFKSATHRVVRPIGRCRHSFAFFHSLHGDKWVEPLPKFTQEIGEAPKYRGFLYKDYQALRMKNKTHPPSKPEDAINITHYAI